MSGMSSTKLIIRIGRIKLLMLIFTGWRQEVGDQEVPHLVRFAVIFPPACPFFPATFQPLVPVDPGGRAARFLLLLLPIAVMLFLE
jgi:hypothetical protein